MHPVSIRIAAAGDIHVRDTNREQLTEAFSALNGVVDLVLLAGDLTTHGEPEEGALFAEACAALDVPIFAVLGNHDWHADRTDELIPALEEGGVAVLERESEVVELDGCEVGIVGLKGFVGGFPGSILPDFGEPLLREVYRHTSDDLAALDEGLRAVAHCPFRIVLLHYSPCAETLRGEPEGIWAFLGSHRLGVPIAEHRPDLVLHGHAHEGTFEGRIGSVPVYNVAVHVTGRDFYVFDLEVGARAPVSVE
jgi:uncharacterized protein